ncbi:MAG: V-type ATP synthase subunit I [Oscillospiraceae bacterium]|nr:V-type ATP synthase subunit I [Oscillospiraceae bacterium]
MSIVKMKRLRLFALASDRDDLFVKLQNFGCVEISDQSDKLTDEQWSAFVRPQNSDFGENKAKGDKIEAAIETLNKFAPVKSGFLSARPSYNRLELYDDGALNKALAVSDEIIERNGQINAAFAKINRATATRATIAPWANVDIPLDTTGTANSIVRFGVSPSTVNLEAMKAELAAAADAAQLFEAGRDAEQIYLILICHKAQEEDAMQAVKSFGFGAAAFKGVNGTAAENLAAIDAEIAQLNAEKDSLIAELAVYNEYRDTLKLCSDRVLSDMRREECKERMVGTDKTFYLEGWTTVNDAAALEDILKDYTCWWEIEDPTEEEAEEVPVKLKSNKLTSPFNMVTEMYSLPFYGGVDPNPLIMPFFTVFFGIMFADMGYGLLLLILGIIMSKKMRPRGMMKYMCGLMKICGISTFVFGALTGSFFGDVITVLSEMFGGYVELPKAIDALGDPMTVLIGSLALGVLHLLVGLGVQGYMLIRDGQVKEALFDVGTTYLMFIGVALGALGVTWIVLIVAVVLFIISQGRSSKSIVGKIGSGLWALYNFITGYFGDILSYCRLMALMLASAVIASVFNTLGAMTGNIVVFIVIFVIGHLLNIALNVIGTFVHTSRLQYLEFFGKFYRDGGKPFQPLTIKTNYVDII